MADERPLCFVIGPIGEAATETRKRADWMLHQLFKPVLEADEFGYHVKRADEDANPGSIAAAVINDVLLAELVIADLTGFNPNAFYELGLRHMTGKPVIHTIAESVRLPFDNQDQRTIFVDLSDYHAIEAAKLLLADAARAVRADSYQVSNPVTQAKGQLALAQSGDPRDQMLAELQDRLVNMEREQRRIIRRLGRERAQPSGAQPQAHLLDASALSEAERVLSPETFHLRDEDRLPWLEVEPSSRRRR